MTSLLLLKKVRALGSALLYSSLFIVALALALGAFLPDHPWLSIALGAGVSLVLFAVSLYTTRKSALAEHPGVGWIALDFLVKIALIGLALFLAKSVPSLEVKIVAIVVVAGLVANVVAQAVVFARRPGPARQT